ncbi:aminopeptidase P family protein [Vibrio viridaestus]|uniref:Aminopeptidase P family protein n=1 Tax=Vibrio viridaestus TaxID=2487322 RepID=A0A3N9TBA5_9VIBR|nr:aminopeptidase P family protein [Vibrio viridaestus]RQW61427.1 aminopeptidase P family protein [Vibrio viridaestus]
MANAITDNLKKLRNWLSESQLDAFIVPHEDEYLGEYLPKHNERLEWVSGFTGSAGAAIVTQDNAAIFVDGRYTVQVTKQTPAVCFEYHHLIDEPYLDWLKEQLPLGAKIGFDPKMHRASWVNNAQEVLAPEYELHPVAANPIDLLWENRPEPTLSDMVLMPDETSGKSSKDKRASIANLLKEKGADSAVLTQLDSIGWLLNIRGLDVARLPVILSHAIIYQSGDVDYFIDESRVADGFHEHVGAGVNICAPDSLTQALEAMNGKKVILDTSSSNAWFKLQLQNNGATIIDIADPCTLPKAAKNRAEVTGMKACHIRDGAAMAQFLCWLDGQVEKNSELDEATLSDQLEAFRRQDPTLVDLSFDTISAAATNAAMCHYNHINQPKPGILSLNSLYLVDSGGHYQDGTTDITRTVAIGTPTDEMKTLFTLVLKGHIALASAKFPAGTSGHQLDALARQYLWTNGYDFDHGTGHGVGHCLSVHEGPQRISKAPNSVALLPGMVVSNEPGYYRENEFGIRIENLELVVDVETAGDKNMRGFEALTRCPIDKRAIQKELLTGSEITWLNQYHEQVWHDVSPLVEGDVKEWLRNATSTI